MARYAKDTTVGTARSKAEIEDTLTRYGAGKFMYGVEPTKAMIGFVMRGRQIRLILPLPDKSDKVFWRTPKRKWDRTPQDAEKAWEQACRQRWRALLLIVRAKLEAVEIGVTTFEQEFLSYTVLPDGQTVGDFMLPQVKEAYELNIMPEMLPMLAEANEIKMLGQGGK